MKVLHVIPSVGPVRGGPSVAVTAMVRALRGRGVEAALTATQDNGVAVLAVPTSEWCEYEGLPTFFHARWECPVRALREFQMNWGFRKWLSGVVRDYDVVHVHAVFSALSTLAMQVCRKVGVPYVVRPLGQLDTWSLKQKAVKKGLYYRVWEKANLLGAAAVHTTSETEATNVRALLPAARVEVIPHGVEPLSLPADARATLRAKLGLFHDEPVLLFLSRWAEKKKLPLLLEALSRCREQRWTLVLAGAADSAAYEAKVKADILRWGLAERVVCPGHVVGEEKALLLGGADLFVLPSLTENFGVAVAEALCAGLRCGVTPGVDIAPQVLALKGGWVAEPTVEAWAAKLGESLSLGRDESLACRAKELFSWAANAQQLEQLYLQVARC